MKVTRKIVYRGHGYHVNVPEALLDFAALKGGGSCIVEANEHGNITVRRVEPRDLVGEHAIPSLTLIPASAESK